MCVLKTTGPFIFINNVYNKIMITITIPKELAKQKELVVVPRKEYEEFTAWKKAVKVKVFIPTSAERRDLKIAREDFKKGRYTSWNELKRKLASNSSQ